MTETADSLLQVSNNEYCMTATELTDLLTVLDVKILKWCIKHLTYCEGVLSRRTSEMMYNNGFHSVLARCPSVKKSQGML